MQAPRMRLVERREFEGPMDSLDRATPDRTASDRQWTDRYWQSPDGLKLHYRDYAGRSDRPPVIILHGLTRNARDGAALAERLSGEWRVLVLEMRGRGMSDYASDTTTYNPLQYVADLTALLEHEGIERFVAIGTSLGGLMTMLLALGEPGRIAAAALVDVGPVVDEAGIARIREYVGQGGSFPTWIHAARALQELHQAVHPDFTIEDWLAMAKRVMALGANGRVVYDYDMGIAEPFHADAAPAAADLWPAFEALAGRPLTLLRGETSAIISRETAAEMKRRVPELEVVTIPRTGHAPTLAEPESVAAIDALLARVA
jgi:pimeloyl-ACP methyl ester carboxylesterase